MKYTTIVFDCDGTLLNTATDLANAVNHVLRTHNFPEKSLAEIKAALGNAVTYLMRQCLPSSVADNELEPYIEEFKAYYGEHLKDTTAPYPGILDTVSYTHLNRNLNILTLRVLNDHLVHNILI